MQRMPRGGSRGALERGSPQLQHLLVPAPSQALPAPILGDGPWWLNLPNAAISFTDVDGKSLPRM